MPPEVVAELVVLTMSAAVDPGVAFPQATDFLWSLSGSLSLAAATVTHPVRRSALAALAEHGVLHRCDIAETAARDDAVPVTDVDRLEISLHHVHLPKLDAEQYIDYDPRSGDAVLWIPPETVHAHLD